MKEEITDIIRREIKARYDAHMVVVKRLETVCEIFTDVIQKVLGKNYTVKVYIFQQNKLPNYNPQISEFMREQTVGMPFACEFVIESPKFHDHICIHTVQNILWVKGESERKVLIAAITETLKTNSRIHDVISYMNSDGFEHMWKDPVSEANKKIILASEKKIDDEGKGEAWKGGV